MFSCRCMARLVKPSWSPCQTDQTTLRGERRRFLRYVEGCSCYLSEGEGMTKGNKVLSWNSKAYFILVGQLSCLFDFCTSYSLILLFLHSRRRCKSSLQNCSPCPSFLPILFSCYPWNTREYYWHIRPWEGGEESGLSCNKEWYHLARTLLSPLAVTLKAQIWECEPYCIAVMHKGSHTCGVLTAWKKNRIHIPRSLQVHAMQSTAVSQQHGGKAGEETGTQ